jgi:phosphodiesterase/alkaline phosphatase D-like protein
VLEQLARHLCIGEPAEGGEDASMVWEGSRGEDMGKAVHDKTRNTSRECTLTS